MIRMDIGKKLKNTRVFLGLTQEEFCAGIVTESFYSRVENNKSKISMSDLISILNYHNISLYDFFASADKAVHDKKRVMQSFINDDANRLKKYQHLLKPAQKKYQLEFKLMLSILNDQIGELPKGTIEKAQRQFIKIGKLDINILFYINLLVPIVEFRTLKIIMNYLISSTESGKICDFSLQLLCHSLLHFLNRCYKEKDEQEAKMVIKFFKNIPTTSYIFLEKLLVNCYECLFSGDEVKLESIVRVLKLCGYGKYAVGFERIKNNFETE